VRLQAVDLEPRAGVFLEAKLHELPLAGEYREAEQQEESDRFLHGRTSGYPGTGRDLIDFGRNAAGCEFSGSIPDIGNAARVPNEQRRTQ
jgi:hypothetical protein